MMKGKDIKSFSQITYIGGTFVSSQRNWETLTKEAYTIYIYLRKYCITFMMQR